MKRVCWLLGPLLLFAKVAAAIPVHWTGDASLLIWRTANRSFDYVVEQRPVNIVEGTERILHRVLSNYCPGYRIRGEVIWECLFLTGSYLYLKTEGSERVRPVWANFLISPPAYLALTAPVVAKGRQEHHYQRADLALGSLLIRKRCAELKCAVGGAYLHLTEEQDAFYADDVESATLRQHGKATGGGLALSIVGRAWNAKGLGLSAKMGLLGGVANEVTRLVASPSLLGPPVKLAERNRYGGIGGVDFSLALLYLYAAGGWDLRAEVGFEMHQYTALLLSYPIETPQLPRAATPKDVSFGGAFLKLEVRV